MITPTIIILPGDCVASMESMQERSVQCVVTSPPYWGLRDYGTAGQIGLEETFEAFLEKIVGVFEAVRRVLKDDGTLWVNMGDSYAWSGGAGFQGQNGQMADRSIVRARVSSKSTSRGNGIPPGLKYKDLVGQPWRLAFALQEAGWYLRRDIIWHKPNARPESITDRPTTAHEYVFLLSKNKRYFYNTVEAREPVTGGSHPRGNGVNPKCAAMAKTSGGRQMFERQNESFSSVVRKVVDNRNFRSVWSIPTQPFKGSHFATFPEALAARCIIAGSKPGDVVLDPFAGSGTTGAVALGMGRSTVLCEINPDYVRLIEQRTNTTIGMSFS